MLSIPRGLPRELEADDVVRRVPLGSVPAPVMYRLADYGRTQLPLVESARAWGRGHIERMLIRNKERSIRDPMR